MTRPSKKKKKRQPSKPIPHELASWMELWVYRTPNKDGEYVRHYLIRDKKDCYYEMARLVADFREKHPGCYFRVEIRKVHVHRWSEIKTNEPPPPS